ncbi:hypothetical protein O9992_19340 [Vibrio lentus]|nr:hypothetical protein [Vibrio lentus]
MSHAELEVDGNIAFQAEKATEAKIQRDAKRVPTTGKFTLDFIKENDTKAQAQVLAGVQDFVSVWISLKQQLSMCWLNT